MLFVAATSSRKAAMTYVSPSSKTIITSGDVKGLPVGTVPLKITPGEISEMLIVVLSSVAIMPKTLLFLQSSPL